MPYCYLHEHVFDIRENGNWVFTKSQKNSCQVVQQIWYCDQIGVQRLSSKLGRSICSSAHFSGLVWTNPRLMRQIPNFLGFWLLHFNWLEIKFLKICCESLLLQLFQMEVITESLLRTFQLAESYKIIFFNSQWFFPRQSNFVPLFIVADCFVQYIKGFLFNGIFRFTLGLSSFGFNFPELFKQFIKRLIVGASSWYVVHVLFLLVRSLFGLLLHSFILSS